MRPKVEIERRSEQLLETGLVRWKAVWQDVMQDEANSYFLSWPWLQHWLERLPLQLEVFLLQIEQEGRRAAFLLGRGREVRHGVIGSNSYYLHSTGQLPFDSLTLEYNQIPARNPGVQLLQALLSEMPKGWDELHLPALDASRFPATCLGQIGSDHRVLTHLQVPSHYVDLSLLGDAEDSYLMLLSANTRNNIRRAKKGLSKLGALRLMPAEQLGTALAVYDDLVAMHQETWQERGLPGAFATDWFRDFHRTLIEKRFAFGETQLLRIVCGEKTVGCIYNFVYRGVTHYYQSGLNYAEFGKNRPGLVCHSEAIQYNATLGNRIYDFLAGDSQYKRSLGSHANQLVWCTVQKPRLRFKLESLAKTTKDWLREPGRRSRKE